MISEFPIEQQFRSTIKNHDLVGIKLYQVNDTFFEFPEINEWIIDAGVDFIFPSITYSLSWNQDTDAFVFEAKSFTAIYEEDNYSELGTQHMNRITDFVSKKIKSVAMKWIDIDFVVDYTMRTEQVKKLVDVRLVFESGDTLQVATIDYDVEEGNGPLNYRYSPFSELLIIHNRFLEIDDN